MKNDFWDYEFMNDYMGEPDRYTTNSTDGMKFAGYDNLEDGTTAWYDSSGYLDCITPTPR